MKDRTKYLLNTIKLRLSRDEKSADNIVRIVVQMFLEKQLFLGELFPRQCDLKTKLNVTMRIVKKVWALLSDYYGIIVANTSGGTKVIGECTNDHLERIALMTNWTINDNYKTLLDRDTRSVVNSSFQAVINKAIYVFNNHLRNLANEQLIPELITELTRFLSGSLDYQFKEKEVFYTDCHQEFLYKAFYSFLGPKDELLIINPYSKIIERQAQVAKRVYKIIACNDGMTWIDQLEAYCASRPVGMVYIGPALLRSKQIRCDEGCWQRLLTLHLQYGLVILLDNRFPDLIAIPSVPIALLPKLIKGLIYLSQISLDHPDLVPANVIVTDYKRIIKLKEAYRGGRPMLPAKLAHTLLYLLRKGELAKNKPDLVNTHKEMAKIAQRLFLESGLWNAEYLEGQLGWFFYLEPVIGNLPDNIFEILQMMDHYIMDRAMYPSLSSTVNGFWINVSHYSLANRLIQDLKKFNLIMKDTLMKPL